MIRCAFAMTLKTLRKRAGIAQEKLALEAGIERSYMSGMERGKHSPNLDTIYKILPFLGVTFPQFAEEFEHSLRRVRKKPESAK